MLGATLRKVEGWERAGVRGCTGFETASDPAAHVPGPATLTQSPERAIVSPPSALRGRERHAGTRVAQLDRASAYGAEGWGFDSLRACHGK